MIGRWSSAPAIRRAARSSDRASAHCPARYAARPQPPAPPPPGGQARPCSCRYAVSGPRRSAARPSPGAGHVLGELRGKSPSCDWVERSSSPMVASSAGSGAWGYHPARTAVVRSLRAPAGTRAPGGVRLGAGPAAALASRAAARPRQRHCPWDDRSPSSTGAPSSRGVRRRNPAAGPNLSLGAARSSSRRASRPTPRGNRRSHPVSRPRRPTSRPVPSVDPILVLSCRGWCVVLIVAQNVRRGPPLAG